MTSFSASASTSSSAGGLPEPRDGLTALMAHISHLTLDELDNLLAKRNQPLSNTPTLSDEELSLLLFAEEAEGLLNIAKDRVTNEAELEDALFNALLEVEETAEYDRAMAIALSQGRNPPPRPPSRLRARGRGETVPEDRFGRAVVRSLSSSPVPSEIASEPQEAIMEDHSSSQRVSLPRSPSPVYLGFSPELWSSIASTSPARPISEDPSDDEEGSGESWRSASPDLEIAFDSPSFLSSRSVSPSRPPSPELVQQPVPECIVCLEVITEGAVISTGCGHYLDVTCLRVMFENATKDASLFPPHCCEDVELEEVYQHLDAPLIARFRRKALEFRTKDPVYCCNPRCSIFLRGATPSTPASVACTECGTETCASCKRQAHPEDTCASREQDEAMLEFAKARGWPRCPSCRHMVERNGGCPHMECRCKAQFCYFCAAVWKTCTCT